MNFYSNLFREERQAFEITKNEKFYDVEIWVNAHNEEESKTMKNYCDKHDVKELE
jgi:hypothetical protein